jgi:hypothetical protein
MEISIRRDKTLNYDSLDPRVFKLTEDPLNLLDGPFQNIKINIKPCFQVSGFKFLPLEIS